MKNIFSLPSTSKRIFGLDFMRFMAISMVIFAHGSQYLIKSFGDSKIFHFGGFYGVELFFVLSGFLIGGILIKTFEKHQKLNFSILMQFWKRRWYRTLPNYYLILFINLIVSIILEERIVDDYRYLTYLLFGQNIITRHPIFFAEAWSLSIEEWFYLSFPVLLLLLYRSSQIVRLSIKDQILFAVVLLIFISSVLSIYVANKYDPHWNTWMRKTVPLRLDAIAIGVFFSWFKFYYRSIFYTWKIKLAIVGVMLIAYSFYFDFSSIISVHGSQIPFFGKTLFFQLTSVGIGLTLPLMDDWKSFKWKTGATIITTISIISYSMYLIHFSLILKLMNQYLPEPLGTVANLSYLMVFLLLTIFLSLILFNVFEKPLTALRDRN